MAEEIGVQERILAKAKEYVASLDSAKLAEIETEIEAAILAGRQFGEELLREKTKEWLRNVHTKPDYCGVFLERCDRKNLEDAVDKLTGWRTDLKEAISILKLTTHDGLSGSICKRVEDLIEKHEPADAPPFET